MKSKRINIRYDKQLINMSILKYYDIYIHKINILFCHDDLYSINIFLNILIVCELY